MSNTLNNIIPKILARGLIVLRGKLVMPRIVNGDYSADAAKKGDVINIPIGVAQTVSDVTPSNTKPSLVDTTPDNVQVPLDQWKQTSFHLTDKDMQQIDMSEHFLPLQTLSAIDGLASTINAYLLGLYKQVPNWTGSAGTTPFATDASAAINARKVLSALKCPPDSRRFVLDLAAEANALGLAAFANVDQSSDARVRIEGEVGRKYGFDFYSDQQVPVHTKGATTGTSITVSATTAAGLTALPIAGLTATAVAGDLFTIAGDTTQYAVQSTTALGGGAQTWTISPPLAAQATSGAVITVVNSHTVNLAFHRDAFAFAMRPLVQSTQDMAFGSKIMSMTDPETGITLRLEVTRVHKAVTWEFDCLYGGKCIRYQLATRVLG